MSLPYLSIDYDEGNQASYRAVVLELPGEPTHQFVSGSVTEDFREAYRTFLKWTAAHHLDPEQTPFMHSSTTDNFVMDGDDWEYEVDHQLAEETGYAFEVLFPVADRG